MSPVTCPICQDRCVECGLPHRPDLGEPDCPTCHKCFACASPDCKQCGGQETT